MKKFIFIFFLLMFVLCLSLPGKRPGPHSTAAPIRTARLQDSPQEAASTDEAKLPTILRSAGEYCEKVKKIALNFHSYFF